MFHLLLVESLSLKAHIAFVRAFEECVKLLVGPHRIILPRDLMEISERDFVVHRISQHIQGAKKLGMSAMEHRPHLRHIHHVLYVPQRVVKAFRVFYFRIDIDEEIVVLLLQDFKNAP